MVVVGQLWGSAPAWPSASCVTLGTSPGLSEPAASITWGSPTPHWVIKSERRANVFQRAVPALWDRLVVTMATWHLLNQSRQPSPPPSLQSVGMSRTGSPIPIHS